MQLNISWMKKLKKKFTLHEYLIGENIIAELNQGEIISQNVILHKVKESDFNSNLATIKKFFEQVTDDLKIKRLGKLIKTNQN